MKLPTLFSTGLRQLFERKSAQAKAGERGAKQAIKQYGKVLKWLGERKPSDIAPGLCMFTDMVTGEPLNEHCPICRKYREQVHKIKGQMVNGEVRYK